MRLPRFTTRRLMVLVAVAAVVLAGFAFYRRAERFQHRAIFHAQKEEEYQDAIDMGMSVMAKADEFVASTGERRNYHAAMKKKYQYATLHPWLPVPPDPPPPK